MVPLAVPDTEMLNEILVAASARDEADLDKLVVLR
jgi:hypothetical protein